MRITPLKSLFNDSGGEGRHWLALQYAVILAGQISPIKRAGMATADQSAIDVSPTIFRQTGRRRASSVSVTVRRSVNVKMSVTRRTRIFNQKSGL
jgi:hypothetical protein